MGNSATYNSWIILSKLITAKSREAIAAPDMSPRATIRNKDAVFVMVEGERLEGSEYADVADMVSDSCWPVLTSCYE
jgi:hypothetical protein